MKNMPPSATSPSTLVRITDVRDTQHNANLSAITVCGQTQLIGECNVRTTESLAPGSRRVADEPFARIVVCVEYFCGAARKGIRVEPRADVMDLHRRDLHVRRCVCRRRTPAG